MLKILKRNPDLIFIVLAVVGTFFYPISGDDLHFKDEASLRIYDRNGLLLREVLSREGGRGQWVSLDQIDARIIKAAIAAEDKRFFSHHGMDLLALGRAIGQNIMAMSVVSGGSTISQQVIRNIYHFPRNPFYKLAELWYAIRLEYTLSKNEILAQYLNRIPFGNQTFGVEAASRLYLGKSSQTVTWSEAAFLMALPKSPTRYNPYRNDTAAKNRRIAVLQRLLVMQAIPNDDYERAVSEPILLHTQSHNFFAPHFTDYLLQHHVHLSTAWHTTLDLPLQQSAERILREHITYLQPENVTNAAAIILDNRTGALRVMAGSYDYFDAQHDGQFNAALARRQPGSALKPFTYAIAFEGNYTAASILADVQASFSTANGTFTPMNYDRRYHGPVRARIALACSYNIPAVRVLQDVGVPVLLSKLHECGIQSLDQSPAYYGHGLTLGNGEVTLLELTRAFSVLANQGALIQTQVFSDSVTRVERERIFTPESIFLVSDILSDPIARIPAFGYDSPLSFPYPVAAKTGTSSDFRDNWTIGYTRDYTVGVWVGNFDNTPMDRISGITGAGKIFHALMDALYPSTAPHGFVTPHTLHKTPICALSGQRAHPGCGAVIDEYFMKTSSVLTTCTWHDQRGIIRFETIPQEYRAWFSSAGNHTSIHASAPDNISNTIQIIQPSNNTVYKIDPNLRLSHQSITFRVIGPNQTKRIRWYINGTLYRETNDTFEIVWPIKPGKHTLRAQAEHALQTSESTVHFEVLP
ncbi:penicillin-binding protein 1C [bacterium]|nr:penicillin-binding protein 1C [bacterium]NUN45603.1 penicillin-binding protein 1C [bacterium]